LQYKKEQDIQLANEEAKELLNFQVLAAQFYIYLEDIVKILFAYYSFVYL
jgi:hypothetical protein